MAKIKNLTVRLEEGIIKKIEEIVDIEKSDRSTVARKLLTLGLQEFRRDYALTLYKKGKCTLWKAAQVADVPLREMMDLARRERIPFHITPEDVDEAWREAFEE